MTLTKQRHTRPRNPNAFPTTQLFVLAIVRLAEPVALTSIFPYAWNYVKNFDVGNESNASFYAGILISFFSFSEALTGMFWGALSDRIGRKPILLAGCSGTMISMLMVGFAPNIWVALMGRSLGGLLNGNIAVIQTMVGELVSNPAHEPRAYSIMPFVWSIGTIIGPAIGGTFADPANEWPNIFSQDGLFARFPYLLPNLICAGFLLFSMLLGYFILEESHPDFQNQSEGTPPLPAVTDAMKHPCPDLRSDAYGTFDEQLHVESPKPETVKIYTHQIVSLVIAMALFIYHSITFDVLFPIFLQDSSINVEIATAWSSQGVKALGAVGEIGLSVQTVGIIMSTDGIIALFIQLVVWPMSAHYLGIHTVFILVSVLGPTLYILIPFLLYLPEHLLYPGLYACLILRNLLHILAYPVILIMIKDACPSRSVLGKVNGLAASAGAAFRTIAPPIAGYLYAVGSRIQFPALAWYGSAVVAGIGGLQCFAVKKPKALMDEVNEVGTASSP